MFRERAARPVPGKRRAARRLRDSGDCRSCPGEPALIAALALNAAPKLPAQLPLLHVQGTALCQGEEG